MNQLSFDFNTTEIVSYVENFSKNKFSSDNFVIASVYDRFSSTNQPALQYNADWSEVPVKICLNIIPNSTSTVDGYLYLDTIYGKDLIPSAKENYSDGAKLEINCYMNFSNQFLIKDISKNLKTILIAYYINNGIFQKTPSATDQIPEWAKFDPSLNMFFIQSDFVLSLDYDYTNTPTCYYRTDSNGKNVSNLYKYANKATLNVCSHELVEKDAVKQGLIPCCSFVNPRSIVGCPLYKEDKFKLLTTELSPKHNKTLVVRKIECYLIREVLDESYSLIFEETDVIKNKTSLLKKFSYRDTFVDDLNQKDRFILEASKQNLSIISDYTLDHEYVIINHIQSAVEFTRKPTAGTKVSFLSKLVSRF